MSSPDTKSMPADSDDGAARDRLMPKQWPLDPGRPGCYHLSYRKGVFRFASASTPGSRPTRKTSRPRCTRSGSGWRRSVPRRRAGGSSPTRRTARPAPSWSGPAYRPHSSSRAPAPSICCWSTASTGCRGKVRQLAQLAEELDRVGVDAALGDRAVRHRCGRGPDDAADAGRVRRVRARHNRRPRHRRHRTARQGGALGNRQTPLRLPPQRRQGRRPGRAGGANGPPRVPAVHP